MNICSKCKKLKDESEFHKKSGSKNNGLRYDCKECHRKSANNWSLNNKLKKAEIIKKWRRKNIKHVSYYVALHKANRKTATSKWIDKEEVKKIYLLAKERGLQVDHIVPLTSKYVCGLHTQDNLRCISRKLNLHKGNRYWPDM